jgi:hypothetical protein
MHVMIIMLMLGIATAAEMAQLVVELWVMQMVGSLGGVHSLVWQECCWIGGGQCSRSMQAGVAAAIRGGCRTAAAAAVG